MESFINPDATAEHSSVGRLPKLVRSQLQRKGRSRQPRSLHGIEQRVRETLDRQKTRRLLARRGDANTSLGGR